MFRMLPLFVALSILMSGCASPLGSAPPGTIPSVAPAPTSAPQPAGVTVTKDATVIQLLASLKEKGMTFDLEGASQAEFLRPAPGAAYVGPSGRLYLHIFSDSQVAARRAPQITAELTDRGAVIDWVGDPHFYLCGPVIALYLGKDAYTQEALTDRCGPEFASANPQEEIQRAGSAQPSTPAGVATPISATRDLTVVTVLPEDLPPILVPEVSSENVRLPSGQIVRFVRQKGETDARAVASGTVTGELIVVDGCLALSLANGEQLLPLWPHDYTVDVKGETVQLRNVAGQTVASVGATVRLRGLGIYSPPAPPEVAGCHAPYQIVAQAEGPD